MSPRPGFVLEVDRSTPQTLFRHGEGWRLERLPVGSRIIYPPEPKDRIFPAYTDDELLLTSKYIDLNVLSIDTERVMVNAWFPELMKTLEQHKFTPIPVQHRHRRLFGGGFHCFTLDTVRDGGPEDYFS